ncbi:MAG TPA: hypothetical protein VNQ76_02340 [Planctomicrobium sp.]|nr:hypothetical protein [Planctomicrobium sp.]
MLTQIQIQTVTQMGMLMMKTTRDPMIQDRTLFAKAPGHLSA